MARLAFFGTPTLASTCLQALLDRRVPHGGDGHDVVVVVCQPDRPQGRGQKLEAPPVKQLALRNGIEVLQPSTLKKDTPDGEAFFARFAALHVDLAVVAAYGRIVPRRVLDLPPRGFVNIHASLLPRWRGAAPIQRALQAGDAQTGVCLMHMVPALDAGDVYASDVVAITDDDDGATLTDKVAACGAGLLVRHLDDLLTGRLPRVPQSDDGVTYAEMLTKDEARVPFEKSARAAFDHCRAMAPWPGSQTTIDGEVVKLFAPALTDVDTSGLVPGTLVDVDRDRGALFACADRAIAFRDVQRPSKARVAAWQWAQGRR
jgi:methionyl-tRNA formyltransferase